MQSKTSPSQQLVEFYQGNLDPYWFMKNFKWHIVIIDNLLKNSVAGKNKKEFLQRKQDGTKANKNGRISILNMAG